MKHTARLLTAVTLLAANAATAQPTNAPMRLVDPALLGFGAPDPAFTATYYGPMDFADGDGRLDQMETRLRLPFLRHRWESGWGFGGSIVHEYTSADFNGTLGLDRLDLQSLELQLTLSRLPRADSGWMGLLIATPGLITDFQEVSSDDIGFRLIGVAGYQFSPRLTLAVSGYFSHSIGEQTALPGIGVSWRPTDDWLIQLTPPIGAIGWRATECWSVYLSAFPSGGAWDIDEEQNPVEGVEISGYRVGVGTEYRLGSRWRFNVLAGVNVGGDLELRDAAERVLREADLEAAPFGMLGVSRRF